MSGPTLSDNDFKNEMALDWTTLKILNLESSCFNPIKSIVENPVKIPVVSGKKKKFACHICGKEYNTKQYVKQHVKSIHKQADGKQPIVAIDPNTQTTKEWFRVIRFRL